MYNVDLIRYITDSAGELIGKADVAVPSLACEFIDEAEELLALAGLLLKGRSKDELLLKEAA
ncbi:MAG: hypothetical protein HQ483_11380 [Rhodospirillales bacterium]|nr:hypothetical protein [Rhodospirillales bacterium]